MPSRRQPIETTRLATPNWWRRRESNPIVISYGNGARLSLPRFDPRPIPLPLGVPWNSVFVEDVDRDGDLDILSAEEYRISWHETDGSSPPASSRKEGDRDRGTLLTPRPSTLLDSAFEKDERGA